MNPPCIATPVYQVHLLGCFACPPDLLQSLGIPLGSPVHLRHTTTGKECVAQARATTSSPTCLIGMDIAYSLYNDGIPPIPTLAEFLALPFPLEVIPLPLNTPTTPCPSIRVHFAGVFPGYKGGPHCVNDSSASVSDITDIDALNDSVYTWNGVKKGGDSPTFLSSLPQGFESPLAPHMVLIPSLLHNRWLLPGQVVAMPLFGAGVMGSEASAQGWVACTVTSGGESSSSVGATPGQYIRVISGVTQCGIVASPKDCSYVPGMPAIPRDWLESAGRKAPGMESTLAGLASLVYPGFLPNHNSVEPNPTAQPSSGGFGGVGVLISGPPGVGKTRVCEALAQSSNLPIYRVTSPALFSSGMVGGSEARIHRLQCAATASARRYGGAWVLLEDADLLLPTHPRSPLALRCREALLAAMDATTNNTTTGVVWLALTNRLGSLSATALGPSRLHESLPLSLPSVVSRGEQLRAASATSNASALLLPGAPWAAERTPGFSQADLGKLFGRAEAEALAVAAATVTTNTPPHLVPWERALETVTPSLLSRAIGYPPREIPLHTIYPHSQALRCAVASVLLPLAAARAYTALFPRVPPPQGLLITGPPGTGKTHLAHALAYTAMKRGWANALVLTGPDIISPLVGASEAALSTAFARARALAPCILVLDHFEALAPPRVPIGGAGGEGGTNSFRGDRLLSVLLTELDGIGGGGGGGGGAGGVTLIAVCRSELEVDSAVLRPGRLDCRAVTGLPGEEERRYLLVGGKGGKSKWGQEEEEEEEEGLLEEVVDATRGLTHAATALVWERAAMGALRRVTGGSGGWDVEGGEGDLHVSISQCSVNRQDALDAIQQLARDASIH